MIDFIVFYFGTQSSAVCEECYLSRICKTNMTSSYQVSDTT